MPTFGGKFSYVFGLDFLRLKVSNSYVWGVSNSNDWKFVFLCLRVNYSYLFVLVILTFGG